MIDPKTLLANATDTVNDDNFDWDNAIASQNLSELRTKLGRPKKATPKQAITIRYDSDIVDYFKAQGKGWQTAMNNALKDWIATKYKSPHSQ